VRLAHVILQRDDQLPAAGAPSLDAVDRRTEQRLADSAAVARIAWRTTVAHQPSKDT
jgi:hypothetical protein